jgi:hypothetical protein
MFESYEFRMIFDFKRNKMGTRRILHKVKLSNLTLLNAVFSTTELIQSRMRRGAWSLAAGTILAATWKD